MQDRRVDPRTFFTRFIGRYLADWADELTELGSAYHRGLLRTHKHPPEWRWRSKEWTHVFSVFFAKLALTQGFIQEWEWRKVDLAWFTPDAPSDQPTVIIEIENEFDPSQIEISEVTRLSRYSTPLRVLVIYSPTSEVEERRTAIERIACRKGLVADFLLIIGDSEWRRAPLWTAYSFDRTGRILGRLS